jgi:hypothetical protein
MGNSEAKQKKKEEEDLKKLEEREKLISIAAIFLEGKNIEKVSEVQKKIFLKKKGLSDEMIEEAYKRYKEKKEKESTTQVLPPPAVHSELKAEKAEDKPDKDGKK